MHGTKSVRGKGYEHGPSELQPAIRPERQDESGGTIAGMHRTPGKNRKSNVLLTRNTFHFDT